MVKTPSAVILSIRAHRMSLVQSNYFDPLILIDFHMNHKGHEYHQINISEITIATTFRLLL